MEIRLLEKQWIAEREDVGHGLRDHGSDDVPLEQQTQAPDDRRRTHAVALTLVLCNCNQIKSMSSQAQELTPHVFIPQLLPFGHQISGRLLCVQLVEVADFERLVDALDADRVEPPHSQSVEERGGHLRGLETRLAFTV